MLTPSADQDFRPPPEPRLPGSTLALAILINVLLIAAVAWGVQWQRGPGSENAADTPQAARTACPLRPLLAASGPKDGHVFPPATVTGKTAKDIDALLVAGKEAAAAGRVRDAEVAYLTSCRVADGVKGAGSIESANARYQLARHYVAVADAARGAPPTQRAEVLEQAQAFYEDSLQRFRAQWGDSHENTRFAAEGLDAARLALRQTTQPAAGTNAVVTADKNEPKPQSVVAAPAARRAPPVKPSFDCAKARSFSERTICSDPELAQLDRDLGWLYAKAKQAADDPAAFRRQSDAEWSRREKSCRDRSCLLRWYADRRQELTKSLDQASRQAERTAAR